MKARRHLGQATFVAVAALLSAAPALAEVEDSAASAAVEGLQDLSLDELAQLPVTSAAKRAEPLSAAAAAVYVIHAGELRASGARYLPEALRLAPQLEVTRIDSTDYSITARGFGGFESATKLLVLMDGRSIYTPLFSGVDWDQHHLVMEDVNRIEVVSGPGGTLWGANAVNGVINITSKSAYDTQGWLASASSGSLDSDLAIRWGLPIGDGAARVYATAFRRGAMEQADGASLGDRWDSLQAGFRYDLAGDRDAFTIQGDIHDGALDNSLGLEGWVRGENLLGRWTHTYSEAGSVEVQAYYDHFAREARLLHDELTTWDIQGQANYSKGRHQAVVGAGVRLMRDDFRTLSEPQLLSPPQRKTTIGNVFIQDEIAVRANLGLTLGLKLEANSYTRAEWMPNARLAWRPNERQLVWASVSRAIRNPSRIERDFQIPGIVTPGRMGSEKVIAYEAGYRGRMGEQANVSLNLFYQDYDELRTNDLTAPGVLPLYVGNSMAGRTYGLEAWSEFQPAERWRLGLGGSILETDFHLKRGSLDQARFKSAGSDPGYWLKVRSSYELTDNLSLTVTARAYGKIPDSAAANLVGVSAYQEANVRLAWRVTDALELSVMGENLLHKRHFESIEARRAAVPRSVSLALRWAR